MGEKRMYELMSLEEAIEHCENIDACDSCKAEHLQLAEWLKELKRYREQSAVDPVKHGKWVEVQLTRKTKEYKCSECGHWEAIKYPYCNCGAKMDGE